MKKLKNRIEQARSSPIFDVLKNKDFVRLWLSQIMSLLTVNLVNYSIVLKIFEQTHSTVAVSLVWIFYALPAVLLGPFAGAIVDATEKRKTLLLTNAIEALVILCYLLVQDKIWPIYSLIFLYSMADRFYIPAESAALPLIVKKDHLPAANTLFVFAIYAMMLIGFSLAGPIVRIGGKNAPYFIGFLALIYAAYSVTKIPLFGSRKKLEITDSKSFMDTVKDGYIFVREKPGILYPLIILGLCEVVISALAQVGPAYAVDTLGIDLRDASLVLILPAGIGAIVAAFVIVKRIRKQRKKITVSIGLILSAAGLFILSILSFMQSQWKVLFAAIDTFIIGISYVLMIIPSQTSIQEQTPDEYRGRVFGVLSVLITLATFVPILFIATIADAVGVPFIVTVIGVGLFLLGIYTLKREPYEIFHPTNHRP